MTTDLKMELKNDCKKNVKPPIEKRREWKQKKNQWCGREDSNLHRIAPTSPSSWRVYHSATTANRHKIQYKLAPKAGVEPTTL